MADLPDPYDYCYEWDGPYGTRKFSVASHNGRRPDKSVPLYTADQLRDYAAAKVAEERARVIKIIETYRVPVGNSAAGLMAGEWTLDALIEIRDAIRGTEAAEKGAGNG